MTAEFTRIVQIARIKDDVAGVRTDVGTVKDNLSKLQKDFSFMAGKLGMDRRGDAAPPDQPPG